jgi:putative selenium metabolism protein SsnA
MTHLLTGATVVTALDPPRVAAGVDLHVAGGRVAAIGPHLEVDAPRRDCGGCLIVPGNVNAHMHAYSALARGMPYRLAPPQSFLEILQRIWWRLDRGLDEPAIRASALVAAREALLAGTTTLVDHHASPSAVDGSLDVIATAFAEAGIRSVLAYEVSDRDGADVARAGVEENRRFAARVAGGSFPLARAMVGAHASFTLSDETLLACAELARETRAGLHVHVAEDAVDEADAVARTGRRVVHRLAAAGALDERSLLAHAVHLDPAEAELVRTARATVAHNPRSNLNNGVGRTPLDWLGDRVALGTDGIGSDLFEEGRTGFLRRREETLAAGPDWTLGRLAASASVAARAFGSPLLGTLEPGAPADLAVLDYAAPTPVDDATLGGHWIFGLSSAAVRDVMVGGELVVRDRRLTRVDEAALLDEARRETHRLWSRIEAIGPHPFAPSRLLATTIGGG